MEQRFSHRQTSFRCLTCRTIISNRAIGTKHRNHCPSCLWSRHVDGGRPGDRLSTCGGRMQPIGLALKSGKVNRYGSDSGGEIMLVHYCLSCGKVSCNRIAGDDNAYSILKLLGGETEIDPTMLAIIVENNIDLLTKADEEMVMRALFGNAYLSFVE